MTVTLAILQGDGIGPEIAGATRAVVAAVAEQHGVDVEFVEALVGFEALEHHGTTFPEHTMDVISGCDGIILGPVSHNAYPPKDKGGLNPSGELRKRLDLFANIRPARSRGGIPPKAGVPLDLVVVRENTEGFYADRNMTRGNAEMLVTEDVAIALRRITRSASMRIAREAFRLAENRRTKVTAVHKANVMRTTCGLFLECCREVAAEHPGVSYEEQLVDAMCALLVRAPDQHDVIVTTNMFGDILSDLAAELSGSLGLAASLNTGSSHAMAQAQHGSAPDIAGRDIANPSSLIGSAAMLLAWLGNRDSDDRLKAAAASIDAALETTLRHPERRTRDLGGETGTRAFATCVIAAL